MVDMIMINCYSSSTSGGNSDDHGDGKRLMVNDSLLLQTMVNDRRNGSDGPQPRIYKESCGNP